MNIKYLSLWWGRLSPGFQRFASEFFVLWFETRLFELGSILNRELSVERTSWGLNRLEYFYVLGDYIEEDKERNYNYILFPQINSSICECMS